MPPNPNRRPSPPRPGQRLPSPARSQASEAGYVDLPIGALPDDLDPNGAINPTIIAYPAHIAKIIRQGWVDHIPLDHLTEEKISYFQRHPLYRGHGQPK